MTNKIPESNNSILVRRIEIYQVDKRCDNTAGDGSLNKCEGVLEFTGIIKSMKYTHRCNNCLNIVLLDERYPYEAKKFLDFEDER